MPTAAFYLIPFRAWELFAGALCALVPACRQGGAQDALSLAGPSDDRGSGSHLRRHDPLSFGDGFGSGHGHCACGALCQARHRAAWVLGTRPIVALGLLSYSAYLWHQPLFAIARLRFIMLPPGWVMLGHGLPGRVSAQLVPPRIDKDAVRIASYDLLRDPAAEKARREAFLLDDGRTKVLVVDDSHAKDVFNALETNRDQYGNVDFYQVRINVNC